METVKIELNQQNLQSLMEVALRDNVGVNLIDILENAIETTLLQEFTEHFRDCLKKPVSLTIYRSHTETRSKSMSCLQQEGYSTWYVTIKLPCYSGTCIEAVHLESKTMQIAQSPFSAVSNLRLKKKELKTQTNFELQIFTLELSPSFFKDISINNDVLLCDLHQEPQVLGCASVTFKTANTGDIYFCSCSKSYIDNAYKNAEEVKSSYVSGSWPYKLISLYKQASYADNICHLCVAEKFGVEKALSKYGDDIYKYHYPYAQQYMYQQEMDEATASHYVKSRLKLSRWNVKLQPKLIHFIP
ncbi:hypothetical protein [Vibrio algarum]|uniref:Uncharacterized protein n=1 Tax=Vibrio algarum TaxID=3020714 RepID=A0ABT4YRU6_9VIBR|nr:hypothetical protein [Vibrio sp. KJ40-1]MDB1124264.1 hypothetical protein [Vibrio sp. KJ40-1]